MEIVISTLWLHQRYFYAVSNVTADCSPMVNESKKQVEVAVRMDSLDEGRPLRYEHSVYVYASLLGVVLRK